MESQSSTSTTRPGSRPLIVLGLGSASSPVSSVYFACPRCYWEPEYVDLEVVHSVSNLWCPSCNQVSNREAWGHTGHWIRGEYRTDLPDSAYRTDPATGGGCAYFGPVRSGSGVDTPAGGDPAPDQSDQLPWFVYVPLTVVFMVGAALLVNGAFWFLAQWLGE